MNDTRDLFERKLKEKLKDEKLSTFAQDLFSNMDWSFRAKDKDNDNDKKVPIAVDDKKTEKMEVLESLNDYVEGSSSKKVAFDGGQVEVKKDLDGDQNSFRSHQIFDNILRSSTVTEQDLTKLEHLPEIYSLQNLINGRGSNYQVMVIGDFSSGFDGESCFANESGTLLKKMIAAMGFASEEVLVRHLPKPANLENKEIATLRTSYLYSEISFIKPEIVIVFGAYATNRLLQMEERLSVIHGQFFSRSITNSGNDKVSVKMIPLFHPEHLLVNPNMKRTTWNDMQKIMKALGKIS